MKRMWSKNELAKQVKEVKKDITTLVDAQGHERFIEGDINLTSDVQEGITKTYGKWSLSGTHLLIVVGLALANGSVITSHNACEFTLPEWVYEKIRVLFSQTAIDRKSVALWDDSFGSQNATFTLNKIGENKMTIGLSAVTLTANRNGRIAFDLLIDND